MTEVAYILDFSRKAQLDFLDWVRQGAVTLIELESADLDRVTDLLRKYANLPMDFIDATFVALCERLGMRDVASVDTDFSVYRFKGRQAFRNVFFD